MSSSHSKHGWVVASTHPHRERLASEHLLRQEFSIYCPQILKQIRHARRTLDVARPLFPGYLFIQITPELYWAPILSTVGVRDLIRSGDRPSFLPDGFIDDLKAREIDGSIVKPAQPYAIGQHVRISGGAFHDLVATVIAMDERDRVTVLMDLLNRPVKVRLSAQQLAAV